MPADRARTDRLSREDRRILRLEAGPIVGHTCKVVLAGAGARGRPAVPELREAIERRLDAAPRLRQRLAPGRLGLGPSAWMDDPSFDIARHVRELGDGSELDDRGLRSEVGRLMCERLDREHPLWTLDVAPLTEGRLALVWRLHHCMADGASAMRLGSSVLWDEEPDAEHLPGRPWTPLPPPSPRDRAAAALRERAGHLAAGLKPGARALAMRETWSRAAEEVRELPGTLRRELAPVALPTLLARPAGRERVVAWTSAGLAELHAAGKAVGESVTVNDVVLAVTAGGFHEWLAAHGGSGRGVRVKVPVSLHARGGDDRSANRDSYMFIDLPVDEPSTVRRLRAINRESVERKSHHDAERLDWLLRGIGHLPMGGRALRLTMSPRLFTFNVSNVPGPRAPVFVRGAPVEEIASLAEIAPAHAVRVSAMSASGTLCFGLCADRAVVPDLELFVAGIERSVAELRGA